MADQSHFFGAGWRSAGDGTEIGTLALAVLTRGASRSINSNAVFRSGADRHRSSGFFSRHLRTSRASARGAAGPETVYSPPR